eukprot:s613_g6.t1
MAQMMPQQPWGLHQPGAGKVPRSSVATVAPAFVGEQMIYGETYRGGLPPPDWWWTWILTPSGAQQPTPRRRPGDRHVSTIRLPTRPTEVPAMPM